MRSKIKVEIEDFLRTKLEERLAQCTAEQVAVFRRVYPGRVQGSRLEQAIELCDRTIAKNAERAKSYLHQWTVGARVEVRSPLHYGSKLERGQVIAAVDSAHIELDDGTRWSIKANDPVARPCDPALMGSEADDAAGGWHVALEGGSKAPTLELSERELHVLQHSTAWHLPPERRLYRNHYCAGPGHHEYEVCTSLVQAGLMQRLQPSVLSGGDEVFVVSKKGLAELKARWP